MKNGSGGYEGSRKRGGRSTGRVGSTTRIFQDIGVREIEGKDQGEEAGVVGGGEGAEGGEVDCWVAGGGEVDGGVGGGGEVDCWVRESMGEREEGEGWRT